MRDQRMRKRDGKLRRLGHLVNEFLAEGNLHQKSICGLCAELWPQVVGPWYAKQTRIIGLKGKQLSVWCDSPPLAQQLQYDQVTVVGRLNERLGGAYVESLRPASVGPERRGGLDLRPPEQAPVPTDEELLALPVTPEEVAAIRVSAERIPDPRLRQSYTVTLQREVRMRKWKRARGWRQCRMCHQLHSELGDICFPCWLSMQERPRQGGD